MKVFIFVIFIIGSLICYAVIKSSAECDLRDEEFKKKNDLK